MAASSEDTSDMIEQQNSEEDSSIESIPRPRKSTIPSSFEPSSKARFRPGLSYAQRKRREQAAPLLRIPKHIEVDDLLLTDDPDLEKVFTMDLAGFVPEDARRFFITGTEDHSPVHMHARALFAASYATLVAVAPLLQQASHNLLHNMISSGVLPAAEFDCDLYFCPFTLISEMCEEVLRYGRQPDITPFATDYPHVARLPDRLEVIDPRFVLQYLWIERNRIDQCPISMAAIPPLTSFEGVDNRLLREFQEQQYKENDEITFSSVAPNRISDSGIPSVLGITPPAALLFLATTTSSLGTMGDFSSMAPALPPTSSVYMNATQIPELTSVSPDALRSFVKKLSTFFNQTGQMQDIRNLIPNPTLAWTLTSLLQVNSLLSVGAHVEDEFF